MPLDQVREFGTWFYQRKQDLLRFEIERSGHHPATWEKKGASLYTVKNVTKYQELRKFTFRLFNQIHNRGGFLFYVGGTKPHSPEEHNPNQIYRFALREAIKRLDQHCAEDCAPSKKFLIILDEHAQRDELITEAAIAMYNPAEPRRHLIEPPFQVESHRYQTMQAADWIAGLVGRVGAFWKAPTEFPENKVFMDYFEGRLNQRSKRSGIRG